jgi:hypothetical protein
MAAVENAAPAVVAVCSGSNSLRIAIGPTPIQIHATIEADPGKAGSAPVSAGMIARFSM